MTANMGLGGHNVPIILNHKGIRKLTPKECFMLQGFPKDFKLPANLSDAKLYHQAGNSVTVPVIERIAVQMKKILA
jgi:DNA (cytosine-5)-methyltransferase 1